MREQSSIQIQQQPQAQTSASQPITVPLPEAAAVPPSFTKSHEAEIPKSPIVRKNHGMLPAVVSMLWVIGWIAIIGGLILTIVVAFSDAGADMLSSLSTIGLPAETGIVIKLIIGLLLSLGYGFAFMGIAGICKMLINIENNTSRHDIEK
jgi:hypothetical protein